MAGMDLVDQERTDAAGLLTSWLLKRVPPLIATWRSRMVCLSISAGIPGLELPEHEGLIHTFSPFLGSSLLFSNHAQF